MRRQLVVLTRSILIIWQCLAVQVVTSQRLTNCDNIIIQSLRCYHLTLSIYSLCSCLQVNVFLFGLDASVLPLCSYLEWFSLTSYALGGEYITFFFGGTFSATIESSASFTVCLFVCQTGVQIFFPASLSDMTCHFARLLAYGRCFILSFNTVFRLLFAYFIVFFSNLYDETSFIFVHSYFW